ncbi:hypothetical protein EIN_097920 [Entamoeba invadens IP1]|uniref:Phorbol-ester/DAG-type domain-containing protein n=1 Tax=Entamoeba invadens IP1 TaxID=370355 RepID=A0A0A1U0S6_ENTIV|nr:hypothetical protein EIN_097920 [Entamoeba invadens IP1]ELP87505.1 hypothetical protein EIN_097920 [Entamoeba invadens IP1]|eukprot:XP_004254276.1 hypothetical protein EIN_097920 [Entamoeba invadens IP1]
MGFLWLDKTKNRFGYLSKNGVNLNKNNTAVMSDKTGDADKESKKSESPGSSDDYSGKYSESDQSSHSSKSSSKGSTKSSEGDDDSTGTDSEGSSGGAKEMLEEIIKEYSELKRTTIFQKEELERKITKLNAELTEAKKMSETRKDQALRSTDALKKVIAEVVKMKEERENLVTQIEDERKAHADTIKQLHAVQSQVNSGVGAGPSELEMTFRVLLDGSKVTDAILVKNVDSEKDDLRLQRSLLENKIMSLGQDIVLLKQERDSNKENIKNMGEMKKSIDELMKKNSELEDEKAKLKRDNETLKKKGSNMPTLSFKAESTEASLKLKSAAEELDKSISLMECPTDILDLLDSVEEMMKDQVFHRTMFNCVSTKCKSVLGAVLLSAGLTTDVAINNLYVIKSVQSEAIRSKVPTNLKVYDKILEEVLLFEDQFKKKAPIKIVDENYAPSLRATISGRKNRTASVYTGVNFPTPHFDKAAMPSPGVSSKGDASSNTGEAFKAVESLEKEIKAEDDKIESKEMVCNVSNTVSHVFLVNGNIWVVKKTEGGKSTISSYSPSFLKKETESTPVEFRITTVHVNGTHVICGGEDGLVNVYEERVSNRLETDLTLTKRVVAIGSKPGKNTVWVLSEESLATFELAKKLKPKMFKLKLPIKGSLIQSGCICGKYFCVGTVFGALRTSYPPTSKSVFKQISELPSVSFGAMEAVGDSLWAVSQDKNTVFNLHGKEVKTFNLVKPNSLTSIADDMWIGTGDGCIKAINTKSLAVTDFVCTHSQVDMVGGAVLEIPQPNLSKVYYFFFAEGCTLRSLPTEYYNHRYNLSTDSIGRNCIVCGKIVHNGLYCSYCPACCHTDCSDKAALDATLRLCSRDPEKKSKQTKVKVTTARSSSTSIGKPPSPLGVSKGDNTSDSK